MNSALDLFRVLPPAFECPDVLDDPSLELLSKHLRILGLSVALTGES